MKNQVGLKHIAIELGVSLTTVSRALNDAPDIGEALKAKVRQKAIELKYTPNQFAKSLSTGRSNIIAIFVDSLVSPYFSLVVEMMARRIKEKGFTLSLIPIDHVYTEKEDVKAALAAGVAGIITFPIPKVDAIETAAISSRPILLFGRGCDNKNINVIYTDDVQGGYIAAKYLHEQGHEKLVYVAGGIDEVNKYRLGGFAKYCDEHGLQYETINTDDFDPEFTALLKKGYKGVFAFDDQLASRVRWAHPNEGVDVVGFNGIGQFPFMPIEYTLFPSISGDYEKMVSDAIDLIVELIKKEDDEFECVKTKYEVHLIK
ncbi:MAG: LacI family transcriptional regulator [Bacilli bacterium]|nr:LacI family transcriptional regulator [Bacilli bacterium]